MSKLHSFINISKILLLILAITATNIPVATLAIRGPKEETTKTTQISSEEKVVKMKKELPSPWQVPEAPDAWKREDIPMLELKGAPRTKKEVSDALLSYLNSSLKTLGGLDTKQLKLNYVAVVPATKNQTAMAYVDFIQQHEGLDVSDSYVHFSVKLLDNRTVVMAKQVKLYPDLKLSPATSKPLQLIRQKASESLNIPLPKDTPRKEINLIRYLDGKWRRVYEVNFTESDLTGVVDSDTGESWYRDDKLYINPTLAKYDLQEDPGTSRDGGSTGGGSGGGGSFIPIQGNVQGRGVLFDPLATGSNLPTLNLQNLKVMADGGLSTYTDNSGNFTFSQLIFPTNLTAYLAGRYANVSSAAGSNLQFTGMANPGQPLNILFNSSGEEFSTAQVNGYYHTNYIHEWTQEKLLNQFPEFATPPTVKVNIDDDCNAYYDSVSYLIGFYRAKSICLNTAYDTVIYHEYGHLIDDVFGGIMMMSLSEGWGDVVATYSTRQPLIGEGFWGSPSSYVRTANNNYQYPSNGTGEPHDVGQAWAGFAWHLRQNLINSLGQEQGIALAEQLIIPTILANSPDIPSAVLDVFIRDDDDDNLNNGTPHFAQLTAAAQGHALYPLIIKLKAEISGPQYPFSLTNQTTITGTATGLDFQNYQLFYGQGYDPTSWITITSPITQSVTNGVLYNWQTGSLLDGIYTLKLVVKDTSESQTVQDTVLLAKDSIFDVIAYRQGSEINHAISGNKIVWQYTNVYLYDMDTNTERQITRGYPHQYPVISGDKIVWQHNDGVSPANNWNIYFYDLTNSNQLQITTNTENQMYPAISGDKIVWQDKRNGNWDIYLYNLTNRNELQITTNVKDQMYPAISGDKIVWLDYRNSTIYPDIYLYNLTTNTESRITTNNVDRGSPDISGDKIVWSDKRSGNRDIFLYDLTTNTERQVTTNILDQTAPAISGDKIVWKSRRDSASFVYDIYLYNLTTDTEYQITNDTTDQTSPAISGDKIVFGNLSNSGGNWDIYMYQLNPTLLELLTRWVNLSLLASIKNPANGEIIIYASIGLIIIIALKGIVNCFRKKIKKER